MLNRMKSVVFKIYHIKILNLILPLPLLKNFKNCLFCRCFYNKIFTLKVTIIMLLVFNLFTNGQKVDIQLCLLNMRILCISSCYFFLLFF